MRQRNPDYLKVHPPAVILAQQSTQKAFQVHHPFIPTCIGIGRERDHDTFSAMRAVTCPTEIEAPLTLIRTFQVPQQGLT